MSAILINSQSMRDTQTSHRHAIGLTQSEHLDATVAKVSHMQIQVDGAHSRLIHSSHCPLSSLVSSMCCSERPQTATESIVHIHEKTKTKVRKLDNKCAVRGIDTSLDDVTWSMRRFEEDRSLF